MIVIITIAISLVVVVFASWFFAHIQDYDEKEMEEFKKELEGKRRFEL